MGTVFVSYRRADSSGWAGRLNDHLSLRFGADLVFQDVEDIDPGADWRETITKTIAACEAFLAVIGPQWLELADDEGRPRISLDEDVLRNEIQQALEAKRTVVPVLVGGAGMPPEEDLPESIQILAARQAVALRDDRWTADVQALIEELRQLVLPSRKTLTLEDAKRELYDLQKRYFDALEGDHDPAGALELAQKASRLLDRVLPLYPDDPWLKAARGYSHKNEAMALQRLGRSEEAKAKTGEAERVFSTMVTEDPNDAAAWNGRGTIAALQGAFEQALEFVERALELDPTYEAAWRDRERLLPRLNRQESGLRIGDRVAWPDDGAPPRMQTGTIVAAGVDSANTPQFIVRQDGQDALENKCPEELTRLTGELGG